MSKRQMRRERGRRRGHRVEQPKGGLRLVFSFDVAAWKAAIDRLSQAVTPAVEAMRQVGIAANSPFIRSAVARYAEHEEAALRLAYRTPLLPEQARSLIREHGLEFAKRVGELVSRGWAFGWAVDTLLGRAGPSSEEAARRVLMDAADRLWRDEIRARGLVDTGALQATPFMPMPLPRARCGSLSYHFYPRCPWPPKHGTPSSFVEVCDDAAVGRVQTACDRCAFYSPPPSCMDGKPVITCYLHPLGRPEGRCNDWEDNGTEAAAIARFNAEQRAENARAEAVVRRRAAIEAASRRPEAHAYINGRLQVVWQGEMQRHQYYRLDGREVVPCSVEEWGECLDRHSDRRVAESFPVPDVRVSTVFVGRDFAMDGPPQIFETMVFGGDHDEYCVRCGTWAQAEQQHQRIVALCALL